MAIGRTFQESFQKALRGLEVGVDGQNQRTRDRETLEKARRARPGAHLVRRRRLRERLHPRGGAPPDEDRSVVPRPDPADRRAGDEARRPEIGRLSKEDLFELKRKGFSDRRLAYLFNTTEKSVGRSGTSSAYARSTSASTPAPRSSQRRRRTCTSTYEEECEANPSARKKVMVLGGGPNRIGQGIEFDYCCVHAAFALRDDGFETIMVNCNPETVSTDYDTSDRLYFEPLTLEDVLEIVDKEKPWGVIVQYGGQTRSSSRATSPRRRAHRHERRLDRRGRGPRALPAAAGQAQARQPPNRTALSRGSGEARGGDRLPGGGAPATCSAAARWRSSTSNPSSSAT